MSLRLSLDLQFGGAFVGAGTGSTQTDKFTAGVGDWRRLLTQFSEGTSDTPSNGVGLADGWFVDKRQCGAASNDDLDLTALTNNLGLSVNFAKIKLIVIALDAPTGAILLRVGPQNIANAFVGPFGGAGATVYKSVYDCDVLVNNKWAGHAVGGATKILGIHNPGGAAVDYLIGIFGVKA